MNSFEPVKPVDIPDLVALEQQATAYPWSQTLFESCLQPDYYNYVLRHGQQLIGYYFAQKVLDEVTLFTMTVAEEHQGKGYGRTLLQHMIQQAKLAECRQIWLEVRVSNEPAIELYRSAGFKPAGVRKGYYRNLASSEDAVVMQFIAANATNE